MNKLITLPLPARPQPAPDRALILPGHRYRLNVPASALSDVADAGHVQHSGIVGTYRLSADSAEIEAVDLSVQAIRCFVWDADLLKPSVSRWLEADTDQPRTTRPNRLTIIDAGLEGPEVRMQNQQAVLRIAPRFELEWRTEAHAGRLGWVRLVESSRIVQFEDGETLVLLDTDAANAGPVLYLGDADDDLAVMPVCAFQQRGDRQRFCFTSEVTQTIPVECRGKPVASVSVLEKYTCYFMQNAAPEDAEQHIWVPVHWPVVWAWSIRVQQRFDGVWDIFRKKLIMPMPTTEAPGLPCWHGNTLRCRAAIEL